MKFHGYLALVALGFGLIHRQLKSPYLDFFPEESAAQIMSGELAMMIFILIIFITFFVMVPGFPHKIKFMAKLRNFLTTKWGWDYSILKVIHNFLILAIQLAAFHVFFASSTQENWLRMGFMGGLSLITLALWVKQKLIKPFLMRHNPSEVVSVETPAPGHTEITMRRPRGFRYKSGQFVFVRFPDTKVKFGEHPYTLSSASDDEHLRFTAKHLGDFSTSLDELRVGNTALIDGPYGKFFPKSPQKDPKDLVFIAGGIGITPFLSILKNWDPEDPRKVVLFWASKNPNEMVHKEFFKERVKALKNFRWIPVLEQEAFEGALEGFLDEAKFKQSLSKEDLQISRVNAFFCGPPGMRNAVFPMLAKVGLPKNRLHFEQFSF